MHISKLTLVNYRNFNNTTLRFQRGVNTIIGENGSGKSNVLRAIRLLLDDTMVRAAHHLSESDFHRGLDDWKGHWIIISVEFLELSMDEAVQALFLHGTAVLGEERIAKASYNLIFRPSKEIRLRLAALDEGDAAGLAAVRNTITISDYETVFTGRSAADFSDPKVYTEIVGDFELCHFDPDVEKQDLVGAKIHGFLSVTKEVALTFIQALRDVVAEFHNNRTNPLLTLLKSKSGQIDPASMQPIIDKVVDLNRSIEGLEDVKSVREHVRQTIKDTAGETYSPASLSIKSQLPDDAERLFQSLGLFVGESPGGYEGPIQELSLGGANLIYLTLKLLEFKYQREKLAIANFLLIEEPEAHIHTHIQKTLFDRISYEDAQIIYTTHSAHISEVSNVSSVNILGRNGSSCEAYHPAAGLDEGQITSIQRYLDAVRSNLLFAKSVLLVEGDAEEVMIPALVKRVLGLSVDELGLSVINIRSTGFKNVAIMFDEERIRKRCAIVTDLDAEFFDTTASTQDSAAFAARKLKAIGSEKVGQTRKLALDEFSADNPWIENFYAPHTFEVDFALAGNQEALAEIVGKVYRKASSIETSLKSLRSGNPTRIGYRTMMMAEHAGKGWFAILLAGKISNHVIIPDYIRKAILFAHGSFSKPLIARILRHRIASATVDPFTQESLNLLTEKIALFQQGLCDFSVLKAEVERTLPNDVIHPFLSEIS
ncbi:ATP-dependent nuclease [Stenotrophomonas rhizophila]|uniref:ATP-dependent nuclease n=1 Tax=Stenotrophomonas rhizophila TaxID=216778 RepID=UPI0028D08002|nr:AAA family ATPase [Stenotrophomonas rhizophila]